MTEFTHRALTVTRAALAPLRRPRLSRHPPLVTVVTATYNWSSVLRQAIASVRGQGYPHWELIVVGDGCTDDSEEVTRSFGDPRVRWLGREENAGSQSIPNNDGIAAARGSYVAYLGHDDLWFPDHLSRLVAKAEASGADVVFSLCELIGPPGSGFRQLTGLTPPGGYAGGYLPPSGLLHRTALAAEIGGWRDYREIYDPPDTDFTERALAAGNRFACTDALTVFKPPSSMRRDSYVKRSADEQEAMAARIATERAFRLRELARTLASGARRASEPPVTAPAPGAGTQKGAEVRAARRMRGLE